MYEAEDREVVVAERREVLRWGLMATLGVVVPGGTALAAATRSGPHAVPPPAAPSPSPSPSPSGPPPWAFTAALPIPAVASPTSSDGGVDRYDIRQSAGVARFRPDADTAIWGYDGTFPGPTIRTRRDRPVLVTQHNALEVPTAVHLHGGVVAPEHDGYPADLVLPAGRDVAPQWTAHAQHGVAGTATGQRTYQYANNQPAATLWYHDHRMGFAGPQVYRGLAGFYLISDDVEDALPLPRGDRDLPLMIADRTFGADGALFYPSLDPNLLDPGVTMTYHHSGMLGDTVTVNGVAWPRAEVVGALHRLRLLNASNARTYDLYLDPPPPGGAGLVQIGSDGGLLPRPVAHDSIHVSPGERYDVLVDFAAYPDGTEVTVRNRLEEGPTGYVMRFVVTARATEDARIPETLAPDPGPPPDGTTADRRISLFSGPDGTGLPPMINLQPFDAARIDATPALGATEIWDVTADPAHPFHTHLGNFRVLARDGGPPLPQDAGVKDTVFISDGGVRLAVTFGGHRGKYVFHCHNLEHGDTGMMANLEVV